MSLNTQEKVRCPKCGELNDITLWQSVTVSDSDDLKQELLSGRLNVLVCSGCGVKALVPTPLLYHDEAKKLMLSFCPSADDASAKTQLEQIKSSSRKSGELEGLSGYNLRFISSYNALLEKILIFDAGLHDKTVELLKLMALMQEPDKIEKRSALFGKKNNDNSIEILVNDKSDGQLFTSTVPAETYEIINRQLGLSGVKFTSHDWEAVDRNYAMRLLGGINNR